MTTIKWQGFKILKILTDSTKKLSLKLKFFKKVTTLHYKESSSIVDTFFFLHLTGNKKKKILRTEEYKEKSALKLLAF